MLSVLPESRRGRRRATMSALISAAVHVGIVAAAAYASAGDLPPVRPTVPDTVIHFPPPPDGGKPTGPTSPAPSPPIDDGGLPLPPPTVPAPIIEEPAIPFPDSVPSTIGPIGDPFSGSAERVSVIGRRAPGGALGADAGAPLANEYAEKPAVALPDNPAPRYPEMLRSAGVFGSVTVRFVIDSLGRPSMRTVQVLHGDHELFTAAVLAVLPRLRFVPAEAGGQRVRVLAEQRFDFKLMR